MSSSLKIDKTIAGNWYENLDDQLIRVRSECFAVFRFKIDILQILFVAKEFKKTQSIL